MDMLLWRGQTAEAEAMMGLVSPDWQKLAQARILTRRDAEGLQYAIAQVPPALRDDPGLAYERYLYRVKKGAVAGGRGLPPRELPVRRSPRPARPVDGAPRQPRPSGARGRAGRGSLCHRRPTASARRAPTMPTPSGSPASSRSPASTTRRRRSGTSPLPDPRRHADQPRARRVLARPRLRGGRRHGRRRGRLRRGRPLADELLRAARRREGGTARRPGTRRQRRLARLARRAGDPFLRRRGRLLPPRRR